MGIQREQSGEYVMNDNSKKQETERNVQIK